MSSKFMFLFAMCLLLPLNIFAQEQLLQEKSIAQPILVLEKAQERRETNVAVQAYLMDDILEVTIIARMEAAKPRIFSANLVGPGLNRMSAQERETLFSKAQGEDAIFLTEDVGSGLIGFKEKTKEKKLKGTLTREMHRFKVPVEKVVANKRYQLWVKVESMKPADMGKIQNFKFDLTDFSKLLTQR